MRAGIVASIRINPRDCQSILDLIELVGIPTRGMSFSQMVSLGLSSLLETQRQAGHLPEPDEFQFANRMAPYRGKKQNGMKTKIADYVYGQGAAVRAPAMPRHEVETFQPQEASSMTRSLKGGTGEVTANQREAGTRLAELMRKQEMSEQHEGVCWSDSDQIEYDQVYAVVYPEG